MRYIIKFLLCLTPLIAAQPTHSNLDILDEDVESSLNQTKAHKKSHLELEDERYLSLRTTDGHDRVLPRLTLGLAQKHLDAKEYILAQYYVKMYLRYYSDRGHLDKVWLLGMQSLFEKLKNSESQQGLLEEITKTADYFVRTFPQSPHRPEVESMADQAVALAYQRNDTIAKYYQKIGKPKAAAFYRAKNDPYRERVSKIPKPTKKEKPNLDIFDDDMFE